MYNCYDYTRPVWQGNTVLHEMFLPVANRTVTTLYPIDRVISVCNAQQTVTYQEGKDYQVVEGALYIPEGSAIPVIPAEEFHPMENDPALTSGAGFAHRDGGFIRFAEGSVFHQMQFEVSYRHSGSWEGPAAPFDPAKLPRTRRLLAEGKPFRLGYLGDSICVGANASGMMGTPPCTPIWPMMIKERLEQISGCAIEYRNKAVGGTVSAWGREHATEFFADFPADLFVIAFGMNDASGNVDRNVFRDNCRDIAAQIRAINPDCEFVFVSTTLPNRDALHFYKDHDTHEGLLAALVEEFGESAALAPVTSFHKYLLTRKTFADMTGNNVNHPNDFMIRVYAQVLLSAIIGQF